MGDNLQRETCHVGARLPVSLKPKRGRSVVRLHARCSASSTALAAREGAGRYSSRLDTALDSAPDRVRAVPLFARTKLATRMPTRSCASEPRLESSGAVRSCPRPVLSVSSGRSAWSQAATRVAIAREEVGVDGGGGR